MANCKSVVTIAGSDTSGGAGVQADLKTMSALGVFGQSAITALTAQNTRGVQGIEEVSPEFLERQIDSIFDDIVPDAVKIGMISSPTLINAIASKLSSWQAEHIVLDPVMVATSGAELSSNQAVLTLISCLIPMAEVLTPNIPEAEVLVSLITDKTITITSEEDMMTAAQIIKTLGCANVLIKGGHAIHDANDFFLDKDESGYWLRSERVETENTHGTGCTLSSAIASFLALGFNPLEATARAKGYLTGALYHDLLLGKGSGPLNHMWMNRLSFEQSNAMIKSYVSIETL